jgi:hypothetical protein
MEFAAFDSCHGHEAMSPDSRSRWWLPVSLTTVCLQFGAFASHRYVHLRVNLVSSLLMRAAISSAVYFITCSSRMRVASHLSTGWLDVVLNALRDVYIKSLNRLLLATTLPDWHYSHLIPTRPDSTVSPTFEFRRLGVSLIYNRYHVVRKVTWAMSRGALT